MSAAKEQDVDITKVPPQMLVQLQKGYESEIDALTTSLQQLQTAIQKFGDSGMVIRYLKEKSADKDIMVPLTSSLYVPGKMEDNNRVLVEVGAGYFIEQTADKASQYCDRKIKQITDNCLKLQEFIQLKKLQLNKVQGEYQNRVDAMRKQMEQQQQQKQ
ncbi:prefoldin subunit [Stylonychia lemnae]|uniref:Prefoldin subunit n=1 Tax=Stylonychia lemnae TaxID=5949 RepID=A0A078ADL1_STYLE|nr:prefoldin subunit [Stylonychia lemnae]|eukprot:CDW78968.1 prefoldin subunit [Stylonychia lemnae]